MLEEVPDAVTAYLQKAKESFDILEEVHYSYHDSLEEEEEIQESELWFSSIRERYSDSVKSAKDFLKTCKKQSEGRPSKEEDDKPLTDLASLMTAPKVELDTFYGEPLRYTQFMALFDELVGNNQMLNGSTKLARLIQYTGGEAKRSIENFALLGGETGYLKARDTISARFGNSHLIAAKVIESVTKGKPVSSKTEVRQLADELTSSVATLTDLEMLKEVDTQHNILQVTGRCPLHIRNKWRKKALALKEKTSKYPTFVNCVDFINLAATQLNDPVYGDLPEEKSSKDKPFRHPKSPQTVSLQASVSTGADRRTSEHSSCVCCSGSHRLHKCLDFTKLAVGDRYALCKRHGVCFNCLNTGHRVKGCKFKSFCDVTNCRYKHSRLLHRDSDVTHVKTVVHCEAENACNNSRGNVYVPLVSVVVNNGTSTWALLDSGSTNTFVTKRLADEMNLKGIKVNYNLNTLNGVTEINSNIVSIIVEANDRSCSFHLDNVIIVDDLPAKFPSRPFSQAEHPHLADLPLQLPPGGTQAQVLIGMDNAFLLEPLDVRSSSARGDPYAIRTSLGWSLCGPGKASLDSEVFSHCISLEESINNLWRIETDDEKTKALSIQDQSVVQLWEREMVYKDGHYEIPIPWSDGRPAFPNNRYMALKRLESLEKRLCATGIRERYSQVVEDLLLKGYAETVPQSELSLTDGSVWYLPHHPVISPTKPDKVRMVFDCAAKFRSYSLNNQCLQGPDLVTKLQHVLLRFRQHSFAVTADVEAMYLQVKIPLKDRNALRFLWNNNPADPIVEYRMTSHLFGGVWCAASSTFALRRSTVDFPCCSAAKRVIEKNMYVDDLVTSYSTVEEAKRVTLSCRDVLKAGGFNLTKFVSSCPDILSVVPALTGYTSVWISQSSQ